MCMVVARNRSFPSILPSQYVLLIEPFCQRTKRLRVEEMAIEIWALGAFGRQFGETTGTRTAIIDSGNILNGREKPASALRSHSGSIANVLVKKYGGTSGIDLSSPPRCWPRSSRQTLASFQPLPQHRQLSEPPAYSTAGHRARTRQRSRRRRR
jgi:hypothetical protein